MYRQSAAYKNIRMEFSVGVVHTQHLFLNSLGLVLIYFGESLVHAGQTHSPLLKTNTKHASYLEVLHLPSYTVRLHNKFTLTLSSVRLSFGLIAQILLSRLTFGSALVRFFSGEGTRRNLRTCVPQRDESMKKYFPTLLSCDRTRSVFRFIWMYKMRNLYIIYWNLYAVILENGFFHGALSPVAVLCTTVNYTTDTQITDEDPTLGSHSRVPFYFTQKWDVQFYYIFYSSVKKYRLVVGVKNPTFRVSNVEIWYLWDVLLHYTLGAFYEIVRFLFNVD